MTVRSAVGQPTVFKRWGRREVHGARVNGAIVQPTLGAVAAVCPRPFTTQAPTTHLVRCLEGTYAPEEAAVLAEIGIMEMPNFSTPLGGAGALHFETATRPVERVMEEERIGFSVRTLGAQRIVLVSHEGCQYYAERFHRQPAPMIQRRQLADLVEVAARFRTKFSVKQIDCYYAVVIDGRLVLRHVFIDRSAGQLED